MLELLDKYDWQYLFELASPLAVVGDPVATENIDREAVAEILAHWEQDGDYAEWEGGIAARLTDGRYIAAWGWCDTTGWGCQDGADLFVASSFDNLLRFGITDEWRGRFGYPLAADLPDLPAVGAAP